MWSHSQQWLSVPLWSEVHCCRSSLDLCGLWLNHNGPETSWYWGTRMRAAGSRLWIQWGPILVGIPAALGCNKPREMYQYSAVRWACFVPVSIYKAEAKGLAACVRVWGRKQVVRSGRRGRAGGGDTDHIWPSWLPSIRALLASLHPPLSPSYPPASSTNTHTDSCLSIHFHLLLHLFWSANKLVSCPRLPFPFICPPGASTTEKIQLNCLQQDSISCSA